MLLLLFIFIFMDGHWTPFALVAMFVVGVVELLFVDVVVVEQDSTMNETNNDDVDVKDERN